MAKLIAPPPIIIPPPLQATGISLSGPSGGQTGTASTAFTVALTPSGGAAVGVTVSFAGTGGTCSPTSAVLSTGSPSATFTFLPSTAGAKTISVTNSGTLSNPSNLTYTAVTATTVPDAPTIGTAVVGYHYIDVYFTPPSNNGGTDILDYTATLSTGESATGTASPIHIVVSGTTSRTATVVARNGVGTSAASAASNSVAPPPDITAPSAPIMGTATAGYHYAEVSFSPPTSNGGASIIDYTVTWSTGESTTGTTSPIRTTVSGATSRTATVTARNSVGSSVASTASNAVAPPADTTAITMTGPTGGVVFATSSNYTVALSPVGSALGGPVIVTPAATGGGTLSPTSIALNTGTPSGTFTYTPNSGGAKTISVSNNGGLSNPSNITYTVTVPATAPSVPSITSISAGYSYVDISFAAPASDGGASIIDYTILLSTGESTTVTSSPARIYVLNGAARSATIRCRNGVGNSPTSGNSAVVQPPPTTVTISTSQTYVIPAGVTNLLTLTGRGQDGLAATGPTPGPPINHSYAAVQVIAGGSVGSGDEGGRYNWAYLQSLPSDVVYVLNQGGSGTFLHSVINQYPGNINTSTYTITQDAATFSNAIPNSAAFTVDSGWRYQGDILNSGKATVTWQEYGPVTPGNPAVNGANTTGFGLTLLGGQGGPASNYNFSNVAVTPGGSYPINIAPGGYITFTY